MEEAPHLIITLCLDESALQNAKLAISLSRRVGAVVFALPEGLQPFPYPFLSPSPPLTHIHIDIIELKAKMLLTLFASLMAVDLGLQK